MHPVSRLPLLAGLLVAATSALLLAGGAAGEDVVGTVRAGGRPYPNAVVWLEASAPRAENLRPVMDQRNLRFAPLVLAVQVGTTVTFPNSDQVFHNVFSFKDGKRFDLGLYPAGATMRVLFDKPGVSRLFCNIHPGMAGYVVAVDTPFHAVSDARGTFRMAGVPTATYTFHAWRAGGPELTGRIDVAPGHALEIQWP